MHESWTSTAQINRRARCSTRQPSYDAVWRFARRWTAFLAFAALAACAGDAASEHENAGDGSELLAPTQEQVAAAQDYLKRYGYFPNPELARDFPGWRPVVEVAPSAGLYDEATSRAVRELQRRYGLGESGRLDAETVELMQSARCGVPDGVAAPDHEHNHDKYALKGPRWGKRNLTWKATNSHPNVTLAQLRDAMNYATFMWAYETDLTFTEVTNGGSTDITARFGGIDGEGGALALGYYPTNGTLIFDSAEKWSATTTTPSNAHDLYSIALHEMGHVLGIFHSTSGSAVMLGAHVAGHQKRLLHADDKVAISALFDQFWQQPGTAYDMAAGANGTVWAIGTEPNWDGYRIYKLVGSNWVEASGDGGAYRITVASDGTPWVVTWGGSIWTHSPDPYVGSWQHKPGCAKDIGAGPDGSVWIVGCGLEKPEDPWSGYRIHKWNGVDRWEDDGLGSYALRIAVDDKGRPWVVNFALQVKRRNSNKLSTSGWTLMQGTTAYDVTVSPDGYAWAVGTESATGGYAVYVRNEQTSSSEPELNRNGWLRVPGGAYSITAGPRAVWITDANGRIHKQSEKFLF